MARTRAPHFGAGAWAVLQLVAWASLFLAAAAHAAARHAVRSRGWQLNRVLVALLAALTAVACLNVVTTWRPDDLGSLAAYAVVYDLADAAFLALLMARARCAAASRGVPALQPAGPAGVVSTALPRARA
jgi:hypothetical protein